MSRSEEARTSSKGISFMCCRSLHGPLMPGAFPHVSERGDQAGTTALSKCPLRETGGSRSCSHEADFFLSNHSTLTGLRIWKQEYEAALLHSWTPQATKHWIVSQTWADAQRTATPDRQRESDIRHELVPSGLFAGQI